MKKIIILGQILLILFTIISCQKEAKKTEAIDQLSSTDLVKNLTLKDFQKLPMNQDDQSFFKATKITDNTRFFSDISTITRNTSAMEEEKPKLKFKWHGKSDHCTFPIGICIIIPIGQVADDSFIPVTAKVEKDKYVINFPQDVNSNFGLTSDGYLPIPVDIPLPSVKGSGQKQNGNSKIKAGIYKANYDSVKGRYVGVVLNFGN